MAPPCGPGAPFSRLAGRAGRLGAEKIVFGDPAPDDPIVRAYGPASLGLDRQQLQRPSAARDQDARFVRNQNEPGRSVLAVVVENARLVHLHEVISRPRERAGPRAHAANVIVYLAGALGPVDATVFLLEDRRHGGLRPVLTDRRTKTRD